MGVAAGDFPMSGEDVSGWIGGLVQGDEAAARRIWERYFDRLVLLARKHLGAGDRRAADEEDVALSALDSFCRRAAAGRFPRLEDRHDLWRLLVTITARKAISQVREARRQKRGGGAVRGQSALAWGGRSAAGSMDQLLGNEPTPEFAALLGEQCERLLAGLENDDLRRVALYKLEGYTNEEIAQQMQCALRTVKRRLARIREKWGQAP